jgi:thiaminase/transcriptional activator TenA
MIVSVSGFLESLLATTRATWQAAVEHRFVDELFAGTLADDRLAAYLVQDYQFCDAFVALLGAATATAPDLATRLPFARQLGAFATEENGYFEQTFDALGISDDLRTAPQLRPVTRDFTELMETATRSRSYPQAVAVLTVAELLYRDWAARPLPWPEDPRHRGWIEVHNNPQYNAWVDWLVAQLDAAEPADAGERERVRAAFTRAVELELAFFDACYD